MARSRIAVDYAAEIKRMMALIDSAWDMGIVGSWKVRIIQATATCYPESERAVYLQRALKWVKRHPEGRL